MPFATQPVRRVGAAEGVRVSGVWPHTIPAVHQLLTDRLDLDPGVTFLVGENGAGKSTLVEAIAVAFGLSPEGGSTGARLSTRATESSLADELQLTRGVGGKRPGSSCAPRRCTGVLCDLHAGRSGIRPPISAV